MEDTSIGQDGKASIYEKLSHEYPADPADSKTLKNNLEDFPSPTPITQKNKLSLYHSEVKNSACWSVKSSVFQSLKDDLFFTELPLKMNLQGIKELFISSVPIFSTMLLSTIVNFITIGFISALGQDDKTGAIGLGLVYSNCTVIVMIYSMDQGLNALIAAAAGAKDNYLIGLYYQRGLFLLFVILLPLTSLLFFCSPLLQGLGIDETTANLTQIYTQYMVPSVFGTALYDATKAYLIGQNIFYPVLFVQLFTTPLHVLWCYLFVVVLGLELEGVAFARCITEWLNFILILAYIKISGVTKESWIPWTTRLFNWDGIKSFLQVTIPIGAILFLDWLSYEVFTIIAAHFGPEQLVVHVAIANTSTLFYQIPLGLSISAMTYVANALGSSYKKRAKNYSVYSIIIMSCMLVILIPGMLLLRNVWANYFSSDPQTQKDMLKVFYVWIIGLLFVDSYQVLLSGIIKGIGKQELASYGVLVGYYFLAMPLVYVFAFVEDLKVLGIWVGFSSAIVTLLVVYIAILCRSDWEVQSRLIRIRMKEENKRLR